MPSLKGPKVLSAHSLIAAATFTLIVYLVGNIVFADYLQIHFVAGTGELAVFCGALIGAGLGFLVKTEDDLDRSLDAAQRHNESFCILDVQLDPLDRSPALYRLAQRLAKKIAQK